MKKIIVCCLSVISYTIQAQIGVNTPDATSTLTVNGSISGKYLEVGTTPYQIQEDDYNIAYSGGNDTKGLFILPEVKDADLTFAGRAYYIKNLTESKTLQIKTSAGQSIRFGGSLEAQESINLLPGRYIAIVANNSAGQAKWDLNLLGVEEKLPEVKVLEYLKTDLPFDKTYTEDESAVVMGNLTLGFHSYSRESGVLMFKLKNNSSAITYTNRAHMGTGVTGSSEDRKYFHPYGLENWNTLNIGANNVVRPQYEIIVSQIIAYDTHEIYRVSVFTNSERITFFIEKIN